MFRRMQAKPEELNANINTLCLFETTLMGLGIMTHL